MAAGENVRKAIACRLAPPTAPTSSPLNMFAYNAIRSIFDIETTHSPHHNKRSIKPPSVCPENGVPVRSTAGERGGGKKHFHIASRTARIKPHNLHMT